MSGANNTGALQLDITWDPVKAQSNIAKHNGVAFVQAATVLLDVLALTVFDAAHSSGIHGSKHGHMRELRTQHHGRPLRTLYAFDPRRSAILLIGGDKTGDDHWYDTNVPIADQLYDEHLAQLRKEGLING